MKKDGWYKDIGAVLVKDDAVIEFEIGSSRTFHKEMLQELLGFFNSRIPTLKFFEACMSR